MVNEIPQNASQDDASIEMVKYLKVYFENIAQVNNIDMVFLYGSFAHGKQNSGSDIDLAVCFSEKENGLDKIYKIIIDITYELSGALNREVSIISIDNEFSHPMLFYNAIISGVPILIGDYSKYLNLKLEAAAQMEDFQLFGTKWQQAIVLQGGR
jgi:predicted nucleotidyltransferase